MDLGILSSANSFLSSNPALAQLANSALSNLAPKSAPKVVQVAPAVQTITTPEAGMSTGMMAGIAAAVIGLIVVFVMVMKRK